MLENGISAKKVLFPLFTRTILAVHQAQAKEIAFHFCLKFTDFHVFESESEGEIKNFFFGTWIGNEKKPGIKGNLESEFGTALLKTLQTLVGIKQSRLCQKIFWKKWIKKEVEDSWSFYEVSFFFDFFLIPFSLINFSSSSIDGKRWIWKSWSCSNSLLCLKTSPFLRSS